MYAPVGPSSLLVLVLMLLRVAAVAQEIRLELPLACETGRTCFVQHYVDVDPGSGAQDYQCGTLTYDGHDGTDFRLPNTAAQVDVIAPAVGRVLRVRDGVQDVSVRVGGHKPVQGSECGNGAVIAHAGGWETQYCHLARGSLAVRPGDDVGIGQRIGRVGLSGLTEFPHLHFTVRRSGRVVDPFALDAERGSCGSGRSLWSDKSRQALSYQAGSVINAGFAPGPVTMDAIEAGETAQVEPGTNLPRSWRSCVPSGSGRATCSD